MLVLGLALVLQATTAPFKDFRVDILDTIATLSLVAYLFISLVVHDVTFGPRENYAIANIVNVSLVVGWASYRCATLGVRASRRGVRARRSARLALCVVAP